MKRKVKTGLFLKIAAFAVAASFASVGLAAPAHACVSDYVEGRGTDSPSIIIVNNCSQRIYYNLCSLKSGEFRNNFPGYTAPGGKSRHTLWLKKGQGFTYRYNWSAKQYPSAPTC